MVKRGVGKLRELVRARLDEQDSRAACRLMESAVQAATYFVFSIAEIDRDKSGMGTTISALLVLGDYAVTAQVGDSRDLPSASTARSSSSPRTTRSSRGS